MEEIVVVEKWKRGENSIVDKHTLNILMLFGLSKVFL